MTAVFRGLTIKVGDEVFVVDQESRWTSSTNRNKGYGTITKIGRKYATMDVLYDGHTHPQRDCRFHLSNGQSFDKDGTSRSNGYGFDVYWTESCWKKFVRYESELKRLNDRLKSGSYSGYFTLPREACIPSAVQEIHEVLDRYGVDKFLEKDTDEA